MRSASRRATFLPSAALLAVMIGLAPAVHAGDDDPGSAVDVLSLHIRTIAPRTSPWGEWLVILAARIKKDTMTAIAPKIDWDQKGEVSLVKLCQQGKVGGIAVSFGALATAVPELNAIELPYLFDDSDAADRALRAAEPSIKRLMAAQGFILGMRGEAGFRHFAAKDKDLVAPADFVGVALRAPAGDLSKDVLGALGAVPKVVTDLVPSLNSGEVVGYDATLVFGRFLGWTAGIHHVTLTAHAYQGAVVAWCKPWFDKLQPELQAALIKPDRKREEAMLALVRTFNDKFMPAQYARDGIALRELSRDERKALRDQLAPVRAKWRASATPDGAELLERLESRQ